MRRLIFKTSLFLSINFLNNCKSVNNCNEIYDLMNEQENLGISGDIDDFIKILE